MPARSNRLTPQQSLLLDKYLELGDQRAAALAAGYTESGALNIYRTFRLKHVAAEYQRRLDEEMTVRELLHHIGRRVRAGDVQAMGLMAKKHGIVKDKVEHTVLSHADLILEADRRAREAAEKTPA